MEQEGVVAEGGSGVREPADAPVGPQEQGIGAAEALRLAPPLLGLAGAAALLPAALRVATDHAGTALQPLAVAIVLAGAAVGLFRAGSRRNERLSLRNGRLSLRNERLSLLLLAGGAIAAPIVLLAVRPVYRLAWPLLGGNDLGALVLRLIFLAGFLLLPSLAAGRVLRDFVDAAGGDGESPYRTGMAAAAASIGLALGGAILLPSLGTRGAAAVGLGLCGIAAALAALSGRRAAEARVEGPASSAPAGAGDAPAGAGDGPAGTGDGPAGTGDGPAGAGDGPAGTGDGPAGAGDIAMSALICGMALGLAAICWLRTVALLAGPTEASTLIGATIVLMGLAAGAILLPVAGGRSRVLGNIVAIAAGALLVDASMFLVPSLSAWCAGLVAGSDRSMTGVLAVVVALALALPGSVVLGAALAALGGTAGDAARPARVIGPWTAGTAAGLVLGASLLVPALGLRRGLALASALGLFAILPLLGRMHFDKPAMKGSASLAVVIAMAIVGGFPASWDPRVTAGGVYRYAVGSAARYEGADGWLAFRQRGTPPIFYREGRTATVTVENTVQRTAGASIEAESMQIDGRSVGNSGIDSRSQILTGEIPLLLHGPAENALVVDFALGLTAGSVLRHPVRAVTVIEREPAVLEAAPIFAGLANNPAGDSRLRVVHDDPRSRLLVEPQAYDVIVVGGTDPWLPHLAGLITDEGYALLRSRLKEKGILAQRFSLGAASDPLITTWMRGFVKVFPSVLLFQISPDDLLLVGSATDLKVNPEAIQKTVAAHASIADDLSRATVIGSDEVVLTLRLGTEALRRMLGDGPSNTDDRREVTVAASRDLAVQRNSRLEGRIAGAWEGLASMLDPAGAKDDARAALLYRLAKSYLGLAADPDRALSLARDLEGLGATARARWVTGEARLQQRDVDGALKEWESVLEIEPDNLDALFSLGMFRFDQRDFFDAERYLARAAKAHPETPVVLYNHGRVLYQTGRYAQAIEALRQARDVAAGRESYPLVDYFVGLSAARLKRDAEAEKALKSYLTWAYEQDMLTRVEVDAHLKLAEVLERRGDRLDGFQERQKATRLQEAIQAYARQRGQADGASPDAGAAAAGMPDAASAIVPEPATPGAGTGVPGGATVPGGAAMPGGAAVPGGAAAPPPGTNPPPEPNPPPETNPPPEPGEQPPPSGGR